MQINLLDCTLRDGGYVNNWDFNRREYDRIVSGLSNAGIDYIEVGIMGNDKVTSFNSKFLKYEEIPPICEKRSNRYTVMTTIGEAEKIYVPTREESSVDAIRIAFFKPDIDQMLYLAENVKEKGYQVFLQAMASYMYSPSELMDLLEQVWQIRADAFYLVDSFGTLYPSDIIQMVDIVNETLDPQVAVGFHAHNNIQLAFANDIVFLEEMEKFKNRDIFIDATIYGMGRGAGNTPLELIADYLNERFERNYKTDVICDLYNEIIVDKYKMNEWGYSFLYFLSSKYKVNMAYIWYLKEMKRITDEVVIGYLISKIPEREKYTLNKKIIDELYEEHINGR